MDPIVRGTLNLEQYRCLHCGRVFYINVMDKSDRDVELICPYGCSGNGQSAKNSHAQVQGVAGKGDVR